MNALTPYLTFNGNCREAMSFYKEIFGGKLEVMTWADAPSDACGGPENREKLKSKVMHSCLTNGSFNLMASDSPKEKITFGDNVHLTINCDSVDEIESLYSALSSGGKQVLPLNDTFWGARFGIITDKFGSHWMLNCHLGEKK